MCNLELKNLVGLAATFAAKVVVCPCFLFSISAVTYNSAFMFLASSKLWLLLLPCVAAAVTTTIIASTVAITNYCSYFEYNSNSS